MIKVGIDTRSPGWRSDAQLDNADGHFRGIHHILDNSAVSWQCSEGELLP